MLFALFNIVCVYIDSSPIIKAKHRVSVQKQKELPSASGYQGQQLSAAGRKRKQLVNPDEEIFDETSIVSKVGIKKVIAFFYS